MATKSPELARCDRCGAKMLKADRVREYTGSMVHRSCMDVRPPTAPNQVTGTIRRLGWN